MKSIQCELPVPCGNMGVRPLEVSSHSFEGVLYNAHLNCKQQRSRVKTMGGVPYASEKPKIGVVSIQMMALPEPGACKLHRLLPQSEHQPVYKFSGSTAAQSMPGGNGPFALQPTPVE